MGYHCIDHLEHQVSMSSSQAYFSPLKLAGTTGLQMCATVVSRFSKIS